MKSKHLLICIVIIASVCVLFMMSNNESELPQQKQDYSNVKLVYDSDNTTRHYYDSLSDTAKTAYTLILPDLYNFSEKIEIPEISSEEYNDIMYALSYDNPDLFFLDNKSKLKSENGIYYYCPEYTVTAEEYKSMKAELDKRVNDILSGISNSYNEYEKELYIHDYLCNNCVYESRTSDIDNTSVYDALVNGKAVCEGYAKSIKLLLDKLYVENYVVTGKVTDDSGNAIGHMWNVITLYGENYYLDVTWDDMDSTEINNVSHLYYNVTDERIGKTHFDIKPEINNCNFVKYNYYNMNNMYFNSFDDVTRKNIINNIYLNYKKGENTCSFCFSNEEAYIAAYNSIIENDGFNDMFSELRRLYGEIDYSNVNYIYDENMYVMEFIFS